MKWVSIVLLSISCFAFSLSPVPADARLSLPTQIEQVASSKDDQSVAFHQFVTASVKPIPNERSRENEKIILRAHQKEFNVVFNGRSKKFRTYPKPVFYLFRQIIHQDSEEQFPPLHAG